MEKTGEWTRERTVMRGSGLISRLDESGTEESHMGRTFTIVIRSAADPGTLLD